MRSILYGAISGLLLIISGVAINQFNLWSTICNSSMPWLFSTIGLCVALLGIHSWMKEQKTKLYLHWLLFLAVSIIALIAILVDGTSYFTNQMLMVNLLEVIGFIFLYFIFMLILIEKSDNQKKT